MGEEGELSSKQRNALVDGLVNLPELHARIIILHYFRDKSLEDIAKSLKLPLLRVHKMHFDAMVRLKKRTQ